eukprot:2710823-Amphidinium_carterae.1
MASKPEHQSTYLLKSAARFLILPVDLRAKLASTLSANACMDSLDATVLPIAVNSGPKQGCPPNALQRAPSCVPASRPILAPQNPRSGLAGCRRGIQRARPDGGPKGANGLRHIDTICSQRLVSHS